MTTRRVVAVVLVVVVAALLAIVLFVIVSASIPEPLVRVSEIVSNKGLHLVGLGLVGVALAGVTLRMGARKVCAVTGVVALAATVAICVPLVATYRAAAAVNLGYTPSAVSQQVAALERETGMALVERVGRGIQPTAAGLLLAEHAVIIGRHVAEAETALADLRTGRTGRLAVRYFATAGASLVAPALAWLRDAHPGVRVDLKLDDSADDPLPDVAQGRTDLALVIRPRDRYEGVRLVHLLDDPYHAVLPVGHPLAAQHTLQLTDLADQPWVGSEPPGPCLDAVLDACGAAGISPDFVVDSEDYPTAQGFVAAGLGIGLIPQMGLRSRHPAVVVREVRNPQPIRAIYAAVRDAPAAQPALQGLLDALHTAASGLTASVASPHA